MGEGVASGLWAELERATQCQALARRWTGPRLAWDSLRRAGHRRAEAARWRAA